MKPLKECRVLVTPTSYGKEDTRLRTLLEEQVGEVVYNTTGKPMRAAQLVEIIAGFDGYIAGLDVIDRNVIDKAERLRVIARYGVGVDTVDLLAAKEKGIIVTNTPGANSTSVAELAISMMLALARNLIPATQATRKGEWPRFNGITLAGKTVGLVGFGSIGKIVARYLVAFECDVLVYDPYIKITDPDHKRIQVVSLDELLAKSDFISLHCPSTPQTKGMVNTDFLSKVKPGAFLINTARGELVDEQAVINALQSGKLKGAAFDVFTQQPPDPANPLLLMPQVVVTPHMGAHTDGATSSMGWGALHNCLGVLRGEEPINPVN
jgi:D-3-phosphoglycerate dehydrogenase